nr:dirigent protein 11 [Phryma leptostachya subsp. asiatica]
MGKFSISSTVWCLVVLVIWGASANPIIDEPVCLQKEQAVKFEVYIQDISKGPNATVWEVARATISTDSEPYFGIVRVIDNQITAGPDPSSQEIGRLQGAVYFSDMHDVAVTMNFNFLFTTGRYRGSTLAVLGRNPMNDDVREVPVVGGTGAFRLARGYSISTTPFFNKTGGFGVLKYSFYILHFGYPHLEQAYIEQVVA